jgi:hypothetical protein
VHYWSIARRSGDQEVLLTKRDCFLHALSIDRDASRKSCHPSWKDLSQGNFFNAVENGHGRFLKFNPVGEFATCEEVLNVAEEIKVAWCQVW